MTYLKLVAWFTVVAVSMFMSACGGGEVVKVTTLQDSRLEGIGAEERAKIAELKKSGQTQQGLDAGLSNVIEATPHFSVSEYLAQYPEARGAAGGDYRVGGYDVLSLSLIHI